ncbi:MAG: hypothetical protein SPJ62_08160 [Inconstantimicrobium porci]|uniref:hypothetical protein n=1 Tax=Inconstantimicrobium porci TaxID=2652291 RepID=UPI002A90C608|nr:hypothetical protein [Inconstantimicrobium porci]MDY5911960.1 hypothetical protein [Inconstantimicrobium porci]
MPNIFDGLKRLSHEELIDKIVILESVNIKNFSKPVFQSVGKKIIKTVNFLGDKLGKNPNIKEIEVKNVCDIMREKKQQLNSLSMNTLNEHLVNALINKLKLNNFNMSDDALSAYVIGEAAKLYDLSDNMTTANKADYIYNQLENPSELARIKSSFTSFNPINGSRKLNREILSYIVYSSILSFGKCFTPENKSLPSYVEGDEELKKNNEDDDFISFKNYVKELKDNADFYDEKIKELIEDISDQKSKIDGYKASIENSQFKIAEYRRDKIELQSIIDKKNLEVESAKASVINSDNQHKSNKMEDELDDLYDELEFTNDEISALYEKIKDYDTEITNAEDNIRKIESNIEEVKKKYEIAAKEYDSVNYNLILIEEKRKNNLKEKWSAFKKCQFDDIIFSVLCMLRLCQIYEIERALVELESLNDYTSISIGTISYNKADYENIKVKISEDGTARIIYKCPANINEKIQVAGIMIE